MSTPMRNGLKIRGMELTDAADQKLDMPANIQKGDNWDETSLFDLMTLLHTELVEFVQVAYVLELKDPHVPYDMWRTALKLEGGDLINCIRFVCSKYNAI
jgi:hypothetical protein